MPDYVDTSLSTLNGGRIAELFDEELTKVLANIGDINTEAEKPRVITIEVTIKPSKDRSKADTKVVTRSKLVPLKTDESYILLATDGAKVSAQSVVPPKQQELTAGSNERPFPNQGVKGA